MNVKNRYLILILLVCLTAGQITLIYADNYTPHLQVTTTNTTLAAGSKSNININLYNGGDYDVTEIEALLSSQTLGVSIINGSQKVINKIEQGKSADYEVLIMVDQNVIIGAYPLTMTLNYLRAGRGIVTVTIPLSIVVEKPSLPMIKITAFGNKITPGLENKLSLTVQNIANVSTQDIDITLSSTSTLLSISDRINYQISELKPGASVTYNVSIRVLENMPIGAYSITAQVWFTYDLGIELKQTIIIPVEATMANITRSPILAIKNLTPRTVVPGEQFSINLEATCTDAAVYNLKAVLTPDSMGLISPVNPTTVSLGDLKVGESVKFTYTLLLSGSASAINIPLSVSLKYIDSKGLSGAATETITIPVENIVKFTLMQDQIITAERGGNTTLEADLLLIGTGRVEFAKIQIIELGPVKQVVGSTEYIGAIDPDSPVPFTLKFAIENASTLGDHQLKMKITYLNSRNVEQNSTISVPLNVINPVVKTTLVTNDGGLWGWLKRLFGLQ
jgi:hypothetical protein